MTDFDDNDRKIIDEIFSSEDKNHTVWTTIGIISFVIMITSFILCAIDQIFFAITGISSMILIFSYYKLMLIRRGWY